MHYRSRLPPFQTKKSHQLSGLPFFHTPVCSYLHYDLTFIRISSVAWTQGHEIPNSNILEDTAPPNFRAKRNWSRSKESIGLLNPSSGHPFLRIPQYFSHEPIFAVAQTRRSSPGGSTANPIHEMALTSGM